MLGPIKPDQLGVTLCHEHLYHKSYCKTFVPNPKPNRYSNLDSINVCPENLWYTNYFPYSQEDNLDFSTEELQQVITDEMKFYKTNGGDAVVEVTTFGKDMNALAKMSQESGVHIVANTGWYIRDAFKEDVISQPVEKLYNIMKQELLTGIDRIKAGVIGKNATLELCYTTDYIFAGEIGTSWPIHPFERNVLVAAAKIQGELNVPVIIHPGRNSKAPFEIMRIFTEAGGKASKTVMSHLESECYVSIVLLLKTTRCAIQEHCGLRKCWNLPGWAPFVSWICLAQRCRTTSCATISTCPTIVHVLVR